MVKLKDLIITAGLVAAITGLTANWLHERKELCGKVIKIADKDKNNILSTEEGLAIYKTLSIPVIKTGRKYYWPTLSNEQLEQYLRLNKE